MLKAKYQIRFSKSYHRINRRTSLKCQLSDLDNQEDELVENLNNSYGRYRKWNLLRYDIKRRQIRWRLQSIYHEIRRVEAPDYLFTLKYHICSNKKIQDHRLKR